MFLAKFFISFFLLRKFIIQVLDRIFLFIFFFLYQVICRHFQWLLLLVRIKWGPVLIYSNPWEDSLNVSYYHFRRLYFWLHFKCYWNLWISCVIVIIIWISYLTIFSWKVVVLDILILLWKTALPWDRIAILF